jgi:hypothetical protein
VKAAKMSQQVPVQYSLGNSHPPGTGFQYPKEEKRQADEKGGKGKKDQCCGAETFCFRSGSDISFDLPFITDFILKSRFFMFFMKEYQPNSHSGFYTKLILIFIYYLS